MKDQPAKIKIFSLISVGFIFFLSSVGGYAQKAQNSSSTLRRLNLFLGGGYAHSESRSGLVDVKAEIQLSLSSTIRAGFGVGYMSDSDNMHLSGNLGGMAGGMMGGMAGGMSGRFTGHSHQFRVIPFTLSLYYALPLNPQFDLYMVGGGGYYLGSFRDISTQEKKAFGPHAGFGIDFKVTERIMIEAEGIYRFVKLKGFRSELHPGFREGMEGEGHQEGFWHYQHSQGEYHFHESDQDQDQMMDTAPYSISLNGFSIRAGIKFMF